MKTARPPSRVGKFINEAYASARLHKSQILTLIIVALIAVLIMSIFKNLIIMLILIALASVSMIYNRWINLSLGIELVTLATVVAGVRYGSGAGILVGMLTLLAAEIVGGRMDPRTLISFIGIIAVGYGAGAHFFSPEHITRAGIMLTVLYDALVIPLYLFVGSNPLKSALFVVTHIIFNIWVFIAIAPPLMHLLAL